MYHTLIVRYGEISLKGRNRYKFENILIHNIKNALAGVEYAAINKEFGRIYIDCEDNWEQIAQRLTKVFGVVSVSPVIKTTLEMDAVKEIALQLMQQTPNSTFKVITRRPNKHFPLQSPQVNQEIGGFLLHNIPTLTVDVHQPAVELQIELRNEGAYLYNQVIPGLSGMPVGSGGKAMLLLSGGIDSPVSGYLSLKRGVILEGLHFYSYPFTNERSKEKVINLARVLTNYTYNNEMKLWIAYFTEIQKALQKSKYPDLNITIMRRMMLRIATKLAARENALALVTGDSLGQVASQTMESIATINAVTNIPIFRPLISMDKQEIVNISREIETYETSILPHQDCCTIFVPQNPATKPTLEQALTAEAQYDVDGLVDEAIAKTEAIMVTRDVQFI